MIFSVGSKLAKGWFLVIWSQPFHQNHTVRSHCALIACMNLVMPSWDQSQNISSTSTLLEIIQWTILLARFMSRWSQSWLVHFWCTVQLMLLKITCKLSFYLIDVNSYKGSSSWLSVFSDLHVKENFVAFKKCNSLHFCRVCHDDHCFVNQNCLRSALCLAWYLDHLKQKNLPLLNISGGKFWSYG